MSVEFLNGALDGEDAVECHRAELQPCSSVPQSQQGWQQSLLEDYPEKGLGNFTCSQSVSRKRVGAQCSKG